MIEFSFIVPVKNGAVTIAKCLSSIQRQSGQFEVIVVDNGSHDRTLEIAGSYPGVNLLRCSTPGPAAARNLGAKEATGKFLIFIDADVELADNWLKEVELYLYDTPVDFLATAVRPSLEDNFIDDYRFFFAYYKSHGDFVSIRKRRTLAPVINSAASICFAKSFNAAGGFREDLRHNEDLDLSLRMFLMGCNLGACTRAISTVRFEAQHRVPAYLMRTFVKRYNYLTSPISFFATIVPMLRSARKKSLFFRAFIVCNEIAGQLGQICGRISFSMRSLRNNVQINWKLKLGLRYERFSFYDENAFIFPRKDHFFLFLDEKVYQLKFPGLVAGPMRSDFASAIRKLNTGIDLSQLESKLLRQCEAFQVVEQ